MRGIFHFMTTQSSERVPVSFRLESDLKDAVYSMADKTGISMTDLVRSCLKGCLAYYEQHGRLSLPIEIAPPNTADSIPKSALNGIIREALSTYGSALEKERHAS